MTAPPAPRRRAANATRFAILAYDGFFSTLLLRAFAFFLTSVSFFACAMPAVAFQMIVGWQATHLALWLGTLSLLPLIPAAFACIVVADRVLMRGESRDAGRMFWRSFATGTRSLWAVSLAICGLGLGLSYNLALYGRDDRAFLLVIAGFAVLFIASVAICSTAHTGGGTPPKVFVLASLRAVAVRPHIGLSWVLLTTVVVAAATLPVVGALVALAAPPLIACGIVLTNRALSLLPPTTEVLP